MKNMTYTCLRRTFKSVKRFLEEIELGKTASLVKAKQKSVTRLKGNMLRHVKSNHGKL